MGKAELGRLAIHRARVPVVAICAVLAAIYVSTIAAWGAVGYEEDPESAGGVNGPVWASTLIGDELWVGGEFTSARDYGGDDVARGRLAVFDINTGGLSDVALVANDHVRALDNDGESIWIGGNFSSVDGAQREGLIKWDALTRAFIPGFDASIDGDVLAIKLHRNWLYVGGDFTIGNRRNLVRLNPITGAVDGGFRPDPNSRVADIDAHGDAIYVAGSFTSIGPSNNRENESSAAGIDWETGAELGIEIGGLTDVAQTIAVSPEGDRIYVGDDANEVTAYTSSGNRLWDRGGQGNIQSIVAEGDRVYVGLHDGWDLDGDDRMLVALRRSDGANDQAFDIEMSGFWGVRELMLTDQGMVAVGEFHSIRAIGTRRVAIFRPIGAYPPAEPLAALGDADGSGVVDFADVQAVLDLGVGRDVPDTLNRSADMNSDGMVNLLDALLIVRLVSEAG